MSHGPRLILLLRNGTYRMAFASTGDVLICEDGDPDASSLGDAVNFESEDDATDLLDFVFDKMSRTC